MEDIHADVVLAADDHSERHLDDGDRDGGRRQGADMRCDPRPCQLNIWRWNWRGSARSTHTSVTPLIELTLAERRPRLQCFARSLCRGAKQVRRSSANPRLRDAKGLLTKVGAALDGVTRQCTFDQLKQKTADLLALLVSDTLRVVS
jgi:hypothetical protein